MNYETIPEAIRPDLPFIAATALMSEETLAAKAEKAHAALIDIADPNTGTGMEAYAQEVDTFLSLEPDNEALVAVASYLNIGLVLED